MLWDESIFKMFAQVTGGSVKMIFTGSAPVEPTVLNTMKVFLRVNIVEGQGMTETSALATSTCPEENFCGNVGYPASHCEITLQDVPDMEQLHTDPNPRGEVCMRGPGIMKGYFRNPEATKETIDERGWLHSGDIGMIMPSGKLKIIDRKKNLFKLSQGEYISPEKIEAFIEMSPQITQCVVEGSSLKTAPVALIVADIEYLMKKGKSFEARVKSESCNAQENMELLKFLTDEMIHQCKQSGLKTFEIPAKITIIYEELSPENDLLTPTFKKKRHKIREKQKNLFNDMFELMI